MRAQVETVKTVLMALLKASILGLVACAPAFFDKPIDCGQGCVRIKSTGTKQVEYKFLVPGPRVDLIIVSDNSGSMSFEQGRMAARFQSLLDVLEQRGLDYRVGVLTTDIVDPADPSSNPPRPVNQNGNLQNGKLIAFENGATFIDRSTPNKLAIFQRAIQRNETLECEQFIQSLGYSTADRATYQANCPSDDERGIFAANLFIDSLGQGLVREGAHLAIVFLGDEDVRSGQYSHGSGFPLDQRDLPGFLVGNIQTKFPGKSFSLHAIIVRPGNLASGVSPQAASEFLSEASKFGNIPWPTDSQPGRLFDEHRDQSCLNEQGNQSPGVSGSIGSMYAIAARLTNGIIGDVCSPDYGAQLTHIGNNIGQQVHQINLACTNPKVLDLRYTNFAGVPPGSFQGSSFLVDPSAAPGLEIFLKVECPDI